MKQLCILLVRFYRKFISPLKRPCCRFYPTCSAYAIEAFTKRGFFVGFGLTVWRILRCNPFCPGGIDLVPEKKRRGRRRAKGRSRDGLHGKKEMRPMGRRKDSREDGCYDIPPNPRREDSASARSADASPDASREASSEELRLRRERAAEADDGST